MLALVRMALARGTSAEDEVTRDIFQTSSFQIMSAAEARNLTEVQIISRAQQDRFDRASQVILIHTGLDWTLPSIALGGPGAGPSQE